MKQYNLDPLVQNGHVMVEINRRIYGFPHAGILAKTQLFKHLTKQDYHQIKKTHFIIHHNHCPVVFSLKVDNFGIKNVGKENTK